MMNDFFFRFNLFFGFFFVLLFPPAPAPALSPAAHHVILVDLVALAGEHRGMFMIVAILHASVMLGKRAWRVGLGCDDRKVMSAHFLLSVQLSTIRCFIVSLSFPLAIPLD